MTGSNAARSHDFPGGELILAGLEDLRHGVASIPALLVSIGYPRLRRLGLDLPEPIITEPEQSLYELLSLEDEATAHSRYNSLIRRLVSFERAAERANSLR